MLRKLLPILSLAYVCGCGAVSPVVSTDVTIGVNAAICVLSTYGADKVAGHSDVDAITDAAVKCGLSVLQTTGILDHAKLMQEQVKAAQSADAGQ